MSNKNEALQVSGDQRVHNMFGAWPGTKIIIGNGSITVPYIRDVANLSIGEEKLKDTTLDSITKAEQTTSPAQKPE